MDNQKLREFMLINLGTLLVAIGVYFFKFPNNFSTGGVSGLSILLGKLVPNLTPGSFVAIINFMFLLLGFIFLRWKTGLRTVYCSTLFSILIWGFERMIPLSAPLTHQPLMELFFSVLFPAIGSAILFNTGASTGGTDIAAMILRKFTSLDIGRSLLCTDIIIASSSIFVFNMETGLFSILGLLLKSFLVDSVIESLNRRKSVTIITKYPDQISFFITHALKRGATMWQGEGAFTEEPRWLILTALKRPQAVALRHYVKKTDPHAFILISNTSEIFGKGFLQE